MTLKPANTLAPPLNQGLSKSRTCCSCGVTFSFLSKTNPPKQCDGCCTERRRALDRILAEKKRRKRGVSPVKGTTAPCSKCGEGFLRTNIKHRFCAVCGEANYIARTRKSSKDRGAKQEGRSAANSWLRERYKSDPSWRVSIHMRVLMHRALRTRKQGRSWRSFVPYSLDELMAHLESLFQPGMTWENCGKWHIDHKVPRSHFKFQNESDPEFKAAWALSNLQPLWAIDNIRKNAKLI